MLARFLAIASLLMSLHVPARAQLGAPPSIEGCGPEATTVARFAARAHGWETPRPRARPRASLGRGVLWHVYDDPACCGAGACSGSSERDDALVGRVGRRSFALSRELPALRPTVRGEERLARAFAPRVWRSFLRAAGAIPTSEEQAVTIAWLVYVSVQPGQGLVVDAASGERRLLPGAREQLAQLAARAGAELGAPVEPRAHRIAGGGFEVTLWTSFLVSFEPLRVTPAGASSDALLRRTHVRVLPSGEVTLLSDVPFS